MHFKCPFTSSRSRQVRLAFLLTGTNLISPFQQLKKPQMVFFVLDRLQHLAGTLSPSLYIYFQTYNFLLTFYSAKLSYHHFLSHSLNHLPPRVSTCPVWTNTNYSHCGEYNGSMSQLIMYNTRVYHCS